MKFLIVQFYPTSSPCAQLIKKGVKRQGREAEVKKTGSTSISPYVFMA
jgi:hypothetical protein